MKFRHNTDIGQNFLIDRSVVDWMVSRAALGPDDRVLEIGPGDGVLTRGILGSACARLDAIEVDARLGEFLDPIAASDARLVLHWGDAVRFGYEAIDAPTRVIANLPYHITTPVLWSLLETCPHRGTAYMLIMTQAEAAERLSSGAGSRDSNPLSITLAAAGSSSVARRVPRTAFRPAPRVDSAIVEIKFDASGGNLGLPRDALWRRLLSGSFATRRKTLANNWRASFKMARELSLEILSRHSLGEMSRPEELPLDKWLALRRDDVLSGHVA
jgi:16S rRNA (adenine1518-N6/adenine1519-N6)-dimethyltransferase